MTRSERLAKDGIVEVYIGSLEKASVIKNCNVKKNLRYLCTDFECLYNGEEVNANVYEDEDGNLYAVIC